MEASSQLLVNERTKVHMNTLERALTHPGVGVIDNSFVTQFVQSRLRGRHEHMMLREIWRIEKAFLESFLETIDDGISFPRQMVREHARGIELLERYRGFPHRALCHRWNGNIFSLDSGPNFYDETPQNRKDANQQLNDYIKLMKTCNFVFKAMPSECYISSQFSPYVERIRCALTEEILDKGLLRTQKYRLSKANEKNIGNDIEIFSTTVGISYSNDTFIVTADKDFVDIRNIFYDQLDHLAEKYCFPVPQREIAVVHDWKRKIKTYDNNDVPLIANAS